MHVEVRETDQTRDTTVRGADIITILKRIPWLHLLLLAILLSAVLWYVQDNYGASTRFLNLMFVVPVAVVAVFLIALVTFGILRSVVRDAASASPPETNEAGENVEKVAPQTVAIMALFTVYALSAGYIGFDLASFLFIIVALTLNGERRVFFLLFYPATFTAVLTWLFNYGVPVPLPTLLPW